MPGEFGDRTAKDGEAIDVVPSSSVASRLIEFRMLAIIEGAAERRPCEDESLFES